MGEMISMIAHQWRQPLSVINTILATLKIKKDFNTLDDETVDRSYERIEQTVNYLSHTIDDFRNFFKENKELKDTTLQNIFDKSTNLLKEEMQIRNIEYTEDIGDIKISTYQNELIQSIINIIKNSIDAFKIDTNDKQNIAIKAFEKQTHIIINIEDNAGGISKDILKKIFEPYFSTKSKNGTGLGLYVCKIIIEEHLNGKLTIKSKNKKTIVIIELPKKLRSDEK
jgi:signal transduction histidine kinase